MSSQSQAKASILTKSLRKLHFSEDENSTIRYRFIMIIQAKSKASLKNEKRVRSYARALLVHFRKSRDFAWKTMEAVLFPTMKIIKSKRETGPVCSIHDCPVNYESGLCGGKCGGKPTPGGVTRVCNKGGIGCKGETVERATKPKKSKMIIKPQCEQLEAFCNRMGITYEEPESDDDAPIVRSKKERKNCWGDLPPLEPAKQQRKKCWSDLWNLPPLEPASSSSSAPPKKSKKRFIEM